ncbi:hypothetical protein F4810DRAFT_94876 [Camillea tinctor]|nr:hypothetical protein F4810DRAFT_94876 [Camillea tinctor]
MAPETANQEVMASQDSTMSRLQKAARSIPSRRPIGTTTDSFTDSSYSSQSTTPSRRQTGCSSKPFTLLHKKKNICLIEKPIDQKVRDRFKEVQPHFERLLLEEMRIHQKPGTRYKPMSMRLAMMGISVEDASPHVVVLCHPDHRGYVQAFVKKEIVVDIFQPRDSNVPSFEVAVIGNAPRLRLAVSNIEVLTNAENILTEGIGNTLCGIPISVQHPNRQQKNATLGGLIKIVTAAGDIEVLGMTAAHAVHQDQDDNDGVSHLIDIQEYEKSQTSSLISDLQETTFRDDTEQYNEAEGDTDIEEDDEVEYLVPISEEPSEGILDAENELWKFVNPTPVGKVIEIPVDKRYNYKDYDWALLQPIKYMMNHIPGDEWKAQLWVSQRRPGATGRTNVIVLSGIAGYKLASISAEPGRVLLGGEEFVDSFMMNMTGNDLGICDGDSGSWVVDSRSFEVYGQLVASDIFGSGYVIPMVDIFGDIKSKLGARSVELPSYLDILHARTVAKEALQSFDPCEKISSESNVSIVEDCNQFEEAREESIRQTLPPHPHRVTPWPWLPSVFRSLIMPLRSGMPDISIHPSQTPTAPAQINSFHKLSDLLGTGREKETASLERPRGSKGDPDDGCEFDCFYDSGYVTHWGTPK